MSLTVHDVEDCVFDVGNFTYCYVQNVGQTRHNAWSLVGAKYLPKPIPRIIIIPVDRERTGSGDKNDATQVVLSKTKLRFLRPRHPGIAYPPTIGFFLVMWDLRVRGVARVSHTQGGTRLNDEHRCQRRMLRVSYANARERNSNRAVNRRRILIYKGCYEENISCTLCRF